MTREGQNFSKVDNIEKNTFNTTEGKVKFSVRI